MVALFVLLLQVFAFLMPTAQAAPSFEAPPQQELHSPVLPAPAGGWWREDGLYVQVFSTAEDRPTAVRLARTANEQLPRLSERLGLPIRGNTRIYLASTQKDFLSIQPGRPPDWADGTAWPSMGLVFLRSPSIRSGTAAPLEQVLVHELVHILVGQAFGKVDPPHWLQEGLASYIAGEASPERTAALMAHLPSTLLRFKDLEEGFPSDPITAQLAYAQSGDLIAWLANRYGDASLGELVRRTAAGDPMPVALRAISGGSPIALEEEWRERWSDPWLRVPEALAAGAVVTFVGLGVTAYFRIRRRNQKRLDRWEREENQVFLRAAQRRALLEQERAWRQARLRQPYREYLH
ncbi:MAG TPA: peptidase MA family metallohydrolase [Myxococcota bacterium]|nr:peptidase MA family metallohydrolase [Myxococcota bacterium]HNH45841.1 peptidase MA family metallohydrolase [Myxococcota bacterium]